MNGAVWRLEWRGAGARRRLFAWNVVVPLLLLSPVALSSAAAPHRGLVYAVVVVFFGTFGSCIPLVREGESGWTEKLLLTGYGARRWLGERLAAHAALDALQLAPVLAVILAAEGAAPGVAIELLCSVALALLVANGLGAVVAAAVRSMAEGALASAAAALLVLHLAGLFRPAAPETAWRALERWNPLRPLVASMERLGAGAPEVAWSADPWLGGAVAGAVFLALVAALAPHLGRRLAELGWR